jgi:hypothetical protein
MSILTQLNCVFECLKMQPGPITHFTGTLAQNINDCLNSYPSRFEVIIHKMIYDSYY